MAPGVPPAGKQSTLTLANATGNTNDGDHEVPHANTGHSSTLHVTCLLWELLQALAHIRN